MDMIMTETEKRAFLQLFITGLNKASKMLLPLDKEVAYIVSSLTILLMEAGCFCTQTEIEESGAEQSMKKVLREWREVVDQHKEEMES